MKLIDNVKKVAYKTGRSLKKNVPTIMAFTACIGVVATAITAVKGHEAAKEALKNEHDNWGYSPESEKTKRIVREAKVIVPHYILPTVLGASTIALILGSNALNKKQQATILAGYIALDQTYRQYREKVNEVLGENADAEIQKEIANDILKEKQPKPSSSNETLFYEPYSKQFFWSTMEDVKDAEYNTNRNFVLRDEATFNEYLEMLNAVSDSGVKPLPYGDVIGWDMYAGEAFYGYKFIDFYHEWVESKDDDTPGYWIIHMPFEPHPPLNNEGFPYDSVEDYLDAIEIFDRENE